MRNRYLERAWEGNDGFWHHVFVILILIFGLLLSQVFIFGLLFLAYGEKVAAIAEDPITPVMEDYGIWGASVLLFTPFFFVLGSILLANRLALKRDLLAIFTGFKKLRWRKVFLGAGVWTVLMTIASVFYILKDPSAIEFEFKPAVFIPFMLAMLLLVPIQAGTEEVLVRGYALQTSTRLIRSRFASIVLSSTLFGLMHLMNPEIDAYGMLVMEAHYISMGILLGIITVADEGMELAIGLHSANNLFIFLIFSYPDMPIPAPSLFKSQTMEPVTDLIILWIMGLAFLLIMFVKNPQKLRQIFGIQKAPPAATSAKDFTQENEEDISRIV